MGEKLLKLGMSPILDKANCDPEKWPLFPS